MATAALHVLLLGPVRCRREGTDIDLGGARRSQLLALLAAHQPHSVSRAELVDGLWGAQPPVTAVNSIQVHVSALRRAAGPDVIVREGDGYRLTELAAVDAVDFAHRLELGRDELSRGEAHAAARTLRTALSLWRGPPLADVRGAPFADVEAARLDELRLSALSSRIEADLALGRHEAVVPELTALVSREPLREGLRLALMQALHGSGRRGEALAVYADLRRTLRDELGIEPSAPLRALHSQLLQLPDDEEVRRPAAGALRPRALPVLLDETVGRQEELARLDNLVAAGTRLLSVVGPGGVGKTRVAIELGHRVSGHRPDGVVFVPLAEAEKPADVGATICSALGIPAGDDAEVALTTALQSRRMLVVCDNFEHVVEAAPLLTSVLAAAPGVQVVVTSRRPLHVRAEQVFRLDPLGVGSAPGTTSSPAADLFLARVHAADPEFEADEQARARVEAICDRCDGLPLAIELAAARVQALGLDAVLRRLAEPLPVLDLSEPERPQRHSSLRASLAWSVRALPPDVEQSLPQLSVFRGGFTVEAVSAVAGLDDDRALHCVQTLVDHSLLRRGRGDHRFTVLETVRQHALYLLDPAELDTLQRRHAEYYRVLVDTPPNPGRSPSSAAAWTEVLAERPNLRAAIRWALASDDGALAADLVIGVATVWLSVGPRDELAGWLERLRRRDDLPTGRRVDALYATAYLRERVGDLAGLAEWLGQAARLATRIGDDGRLAWVVTFLAWHAVLAGDEARVGELVARSTALSAMHPADLELGARTLMLHGLVCPELSQAVARLEEGLRFARVNMLDVTSLGLLANLAERTLRLGEPRRALRLADEGIPLATVLGAVENVGVLLALRAYALLLLGKVSESRRDALDGMHHAVALGNVVFGRHGLVFLAAGTARDDPGRAAHLLGIADAGRPAVDHSAVEHAVDRFLADLPERLGAGYAPAHDAGRQLVSERGMLAALQSVLDGANHEPAGGR